MNADTLRAAGVDYDEGLKRMCGSEALYQKFLNKFLEDKSIEQLRENISKGDIEGAFHAVHALKGLSGNLSLKPLYEKSCILCEKLREGQAGDPEEVAAVYEAYDAMARAIRE